MATVRQTQTAPRRTAPRGTTQRTNRTANVPRTEAVTDAEGNQNKDTVRGKIGIFYVKSFVFIVSGTLLLTLWSCYTVTDIKDLLLAISGILSGPLGFIIGFYFKDELEKRNNL